MARIPQSIAARPLELGNVVQYPTNDPIGAAVAHGGAQIASAGEYLQNRAERLERFKSIQEFNAFDSDVRGALKEKASNMPEGGAGFHDTFMSDDYEQRKADFLEKQPPRLRPELEARFTAHMAKVSELAATAEVAEGNRYQVTGITNRTDAAKNTILQAGPEAAPNFVRDLDEMIDAATLSPAAKTAAKQQMRADLAETGFIALKNRDPEAAQNVAAGWGVGKTTASARERDAISFFTSKGLSPLASVALVGRLSHESGGMRTNAVNPKDGRDGSDSIGLGQWNAERKDALKRFADAQGKPVSDFNTQLEFAWSELNTSEKKALTMLQNAKSPDEAARAAIEFERPKGWKPDGSHRNEDVAGFGDQMRRTKALLSSADLPGGGVEADPRFNDIPAGRRMVLAGQADLAVRQAQAERSQADTAQQRALFNDLQTRIIDNQATLADVQKARQDGWLRDADQINKATKAIEARDANLANVTNFNKAMATPGFVWNVVDKDHKNWIDAGFEAGGSKIDTLQSIAEKTNIIPKAAGVALRGAIISNDSTRAQNALTVASNLLTLSPNIFAGVDGRKEIEDAAVKYRQYVDSHGLSAQDAVAKIIKEQGPEYQAELKKTIKAEDIDAVLKKEAVNGTLQADLKSAFNQSFFPIGFRPNVEFTPEARVALTGDYAELVKDKYLEGNGDIKVAKKLAQEQLKKVWGVTDVSGSSVLMRFPPERAQVYAGIPDASKLIAAQAIADIKIATGQDVERSKLMLTPVSGGQTARAYEAGEVPPYTLSWLDKNGAVQMLNPGKAFIADPAPMRDKVSADRKAALEAHSLAATPGLDRREQIQAVRTGLREDARGRLLEARKEVGLDTAATP